MRWSCIHASHRSRTFTAMALLPTGSISRPQDGMRMEMDARAVRFQRAVPHVNWRKGDSCSGSAPHKHKAHPSQAPWATVYGYIGRTEEHTSELQSLMRISYATLCWKQTQHDT